MERKLADRRSNFKKSFDDPRRKREDLQLQIRKTHREQNFAKKRMEAFEPQQQDGVLLGSSSSPGFPGGAAAGSSMVGAVGGDLQQQQGGMGEVGLPGGMMVSDAMTCSSGSADQQLMQQQQQAGDGSGGAVGEQQSNAAAGGKKYVFKPNELPDMMKMLLSGDAELEFHATELFRRALSIESKPPIQEVIEAGAVPLFVKFLHCHDRPRLQFEAAWALTNIASGTQEQTQVVIQHGAVPVFVSLLASPTDDVREQAVWALGNIAGDSPQCRDLVLQAGALSPLLEQLNDPHVKYTMKRNATWTLSNLCRGKPQPPFEWVQPALSTLSSLIYSSDIEVVTDACWALSYLSDGPNERIDAIIEAAVSRRLVELLGHASPLVQTPALRTVGNIVTGDDRQTEVVIQCGAVPALLKLLSSPKKGIQKEACWTVSNITAGNREQIERVLEEGLIPRLITLLSTGDFDVRREAAWAVSNAASGGNKRQIEHLVRYGCVPPLCALLGTADVKVVSIALEALENILRVGRQKKEEEHLQENPFAQLVEQADGLVLIEKLQDAANQDIYDKAWRIICTYFAYEEADSNDIDVDSASTGVPSSAADPLQQSFGAAAPHGGFNFGQ